MPPLAPEQYITFERFLDDPTIDEHSEWVDGRVVPMHAVAEPHDRIVRWLDRLLGTYVQQRGIGRVLGEPFVMKLEPDLPGRSPDLMLVRTEHLDRIRHNHLQGPADLAIEVTSPDSQTRDRIHKLAEYERGGVEEYWLIDPEREEAIFHRRGGDGRYAITPPDAEGVYRTPQLPEAALRVDWLWRRTPPTVLDILRQWGII